MPTNMSIARGRSDEAEAGWQADVTVLSLALIACLANLVLIALSPTLATAVASLGQ